MCAYIYIYIYTELPTIYPNILEISWSISLCRTLLQVYITSDSCLVRMWTILFVIRLALFASFPFGQQHRTATTILLLHHLRPKSIAAPTMLLKYTNGITLSSKNVLRRHMAFLFSCCGPAEVRELAVHLLLLTIINRGCRTTYRGYIIANRGCPTSHRGCMIVYRGCAKAYQ